MPNNEWDDIVGQVLHQETQDTATTIRNNVQSAITANPDKEAQYKHLSQFMGVPIETVRNNPDAVKQQASVQQMDAGKIAQDFPHTAQFLTNPENTKIVHDDVPGTALVEQTVKALPVPNPFNGNPIDELDKPAPGLVDKIGSNLASIVSAPGAESAPVAMFKGLGGSFNKAASSFNLALGGLPTLYDKAHSLITGQNQTGASDWWFRNMVDPVANQQGTFEPDKNANFSVKAFHTTGNLLGVLSQITLSGTGGEGAQAATTIPQMLTNAVEHGTKSMVFPALTDAVDTGNKVYAQTGDAGAAARAAQMQYITSTASGIVPLNAPGSALVRAGTGFASGVATGESNRQLMNLVMPASMRSPFSFEELMLSGLTGSVMGTVMGPRAEPAFHDAIRQTYVEAAKADAAQKTGEMLQAVGQAATASKLRERDPAAFREFVQKVTDDGHLQDVYIDARELTDALNQSGVTADALAALMPEVAAQLHEASQTKSDVRIPVADYATHIAGGPIDQAILPHLKAEPDGMTYKQGQEFYQSQAETMKVQADQLAQAKQTDDAFQAERQAVMDHFTERLNSIDRFTPDVNKAYATMMREFYTTMAGRYGVTPTEMLKRSPVKIGAERLSGEGLDQSAAEFFRGLGMEAGANEKQVGKFHDEVSWKNYATDEKTGFPVWSGDKIGLQNPRDVTETHDVFYKPLGNERAVKYDIHDATGKKVGYTVVELEGDMPKRLLDIQIDKSEQGKQHAENTVAALAADAGELGVWKIIDSARSWWDRIGTRTLDEHDGAISFRDYADARAGREDARSLGQSLKQENRGAYSPSTKTIALLKDADLSTFIHESGHFFLDTLHDMAARMDAPAGIKQDMATLLDWFGIKGDKPVKPGFVRFYHGGATPDGGARWLTPDPKYAEGYAAKSRGAKVYYVDIPEDSTLLSKAFDDSGASVKAPYVAFEAPADIAKDLKQAVPSPLEAWRSMSIDQQRESHEKFARGFESYVMEGKAPSIELAGVFSSFRSWLLNIYKSLSNLHVSLTPEVRGVFDRLLASDEAIRQAQQVRGYEPLFKSAEAAGMTPKEFAQYQNLGAAATESAVAEMDRKSLNDMKWLSNAKGVALKAIQKEAAGKRKSVQDEVTKAVMAEPINQARTWLKKGEMVNEQGETVKAEKGFRLNTDALAEMYPGGMLGRPDLDGLRGMTAKDGLHPDIVAEMFGFQSGGDLVNSLLHEQPAKDKIAALTDEVMLQRHGELVDPASIERAAEAAIHNEARARFVATELKALSKAMGPARMLAEAAKQAAEAAISAKRVRDIRPVQYTAAEARAARNAEKALGKDDIQTAAVEKRAQLLNNRLAKAATDAIEEIRKGVDRMKRLQKAAAQSNMRGEYLSQLNALLDRFDLRTSLSNKEIDQARTPLADWVAGESERLSAVVPDLPAWILNEGFRTHYKNLTVEEFRGLLDTAKQLEHLARREQKQYMAIRDMEYGQEVTAILDRLREYNPKSFDANGEPLSLEPDFVPTMRKAVTAMGDKFAGEFLNAETILSILEGGKFGQVHESLFGRMSERANWKATRLGEIYKQMKPVFSEYNLKERFDFSHKDIGQPIGMSLTRENALVVALLHGNADGRERLANYGWSEQRQRQIINLLDARDMKLADAIWRLFDENLWPELKDLNDRTRGKSPPKVEPLPYTTEHGTARGGYFRLKYDTNLDERAHRMDEGAAVKELLGGGMGMSAKTSQGSSTERQQGVKMRPRLDLSVFAEAVNETVHDLAFRESVADTMRLLNEKGIQDAIKSAAGVPAYRALVARVREVAAPPHNPSGFIEKSATIARKNTVVTLMSGVMTALQNVTGLVPALARVNAGLLARETGKFYGPRMKEMYEFATSQSEYMRNRHNSFDRDLQDMTKKLTVNGRILPETGTWLALMGVIDKGVSVPIWNAAFADGMKINGNDHSKAVDYADHIVRQTQGSGRDVDLPKIMSGQGGYGQLKRVFTMFYSYFNGQLNMLVRSGAIAKQAAADNPGLAAATFAKDFMLVFVIPAVLTEMFFSRGSKEEDPDKWLGRYTHALAMYGAGMLPVVRDLASFAWAQFDHDVSNYGYKISPVQSAGEGIVKGAVAVGKIYSGEGDDRLTKDTIMGASYAIGLPGKLIADTTLGVKGWIESGNDWGARALAKLP